MGPDATPPAAGPANRKRIMAEHDRNHATIREAAWRLITGATLAGVIFIAGLLWGMNAKLHVIEATMVTQSELNDVENRIPPQWLRDQVTKIENDLNRHIESSVTQAHRGGVP